MRAIRLTTLYYTTDGKMFTKGLDLAQCQIVSGRVAWHTVLLTLRI